MHKEVQNCHTNKLAKWKFSLEERAQTSTKSRYTEMEGSAFCGRTELLLLTTLAMHDPSAHCTDWYYVQDERPDQNGHRLPFIAFYVRRYPLFAEQP